jgi:Tol biopolymer transport system component
MEAADDIGPVDGGCRYTATINLFKTDGSIGGRFNPATKTLAYSRPNASGSYKVFLSDADGNNERALTWSEWGASQHQFAVEWHPSGKYLFVEVEKPQHPGSSTDAIPGYGAYTDLWAITPDGAHAFKLFDTPNDYDHAITHAAMNARGDTLTFTERVKAPQAFNLALSAGAYVFNVADFVDGETPSLSNLRAVKPSDADQGGEVDGISDDGKTISFYSTFESNNLFATPIYSMNVDGSELTRLSSASFSQAPRFTPDGSGFVYMSGQEADIFPGEVQGADWWFVDPTGTHRQRLTFMNKKGDPQSVGHYRLAGTLSFLQDGTLSFFGDIMTKPLGLTGEFARVDVSCSH